MWLFLAPLIRSPSCLPAGDACIAVRPVAGNGTILDLGRPIPDRDGIDDLPARLACRRRSFAPPHDPAAAQMHQKLLLENATRLNEQAFVDRLMRHSHGAILGMPGAQPPGDLLRRPLPGRLSGDQGAQGRIGCQQARLGSAGAIQRPRVGADGAIRPATAIAGDFTTDRGRRPSETSADLSAGEPINKASRYLLPLRQAERSPLARPRRRRKAPVRRDDAEH
jgi:hypothetical protein